MWHKLIANIRKIIFFLYLPLLLHSSDFILGDKFLIQGAVAKEIETIGKELKQKTGISAYVLIKDTISSSKEQSSRAERLSFIKSIESTLEPPYFLIFFAKKDQKIDFIFSNDLKGTIDTEEIYKNFMVPFLPIKKTDTLSQGRISTILLNGYAHFSDALAKTRHTRVADSLIDRNGQLLAKLAHYILILMLISLIGTFLFKILRRKNG